MQTFLFILLIIIALLLFTSADRLLPEVTARSNRADPPNLLPQEEGVEVTAGLDLDLGLTGSVRSIETQKGVTGDGQDVNTGVTVRGLVLTTEAPPGGWIASEGAGEATTSSINPGGGGGGGQDGDAGDRGAISVAECALACSSRVSWGFCKRVTQSGFKRLHFHGSTEPSTFLTVTLRSTHPVKVFLLI